MQDRRSQWQILTLFLTAFAASISQESLDPRALTHIIPATSLPDQMCALRDPSLLLEEFLSYLVDLLCSSSPLARDTAREALGLDLSPKLYVQAFKHINL